MKKVLFLLAVAMMLGPAMPIIAQQRKTVKRSNNVQRKTTSASNPKAQIAAPVKTIAIIDIKTGIKSFCVTDDAIYYLEKGNNNAVMSIDRKTGEISTVIPGIANVYEGARPCIRKIFVCGNRLILECGKNSFTDDGIYVYDGQDVKSSLKLSNNGLFVVGNDKYFLTDNPDLREISYWSVEDLKLIKKVEGGNAKGWFTPEFIASDGSVWATTGLDAECFTLSGTRRDYSLEKEDYVLQVRNGSAQGGLNGCKVQKGDYLYVSCGRRVYRMNMLSPGKWEEYAKTPPTINNRFEWFCPDSKGNLYTQGVSTGDYNTQYWKVGEFDSPKSLGRDLMTGLTKWGYTKIWLTLHKNVTDKDGNLISVGDKEFWIYNPNGVIGYTKAVGKVIEKE